MTYLWMRIDPMSLSMMFAIIAFIVGIGYLVYDAINNFVEDHKDHKN